ncbi:MAG: indole-3-glycerol phosphate synthase TrpC [Anaerolineae bacterium]|nr:indole-3-glycerol phosphate synthase TrpC [Anaerolineae bacterium]MDW8070675.1 indole-3-glycerol phosphate synthase TrpC [Anaerolineae bacterium]
MGSILDEIAAYKRTHELPERMRRVPLSVLQAQAAQAPPPRDLVAALRRHPPVALIAEVKRASPSRGMLNPHFDPVQLATCYAVGGAAAISVVTDTPFFRGNLADLSAIRVHFDRLASAAEGPSVADGCHRPGVAETDASRPVSPLPLLRKDFLIHPYQVYEARAAGADAVLLIAALLDDAMLQEMLALAGALGMAALVEVHTAEELARVLPLRPPLIGVNNRNLHTFEVALDTCLQLRPFVPPEICYVAESGIHSAADVARLHAAGVDAMLIGEALVTAPDVGAKIQELCYGVRQDLRADERA